MLAEGRPRFSGWAKTARPVPSINILAGIIKQSPVETPICKGREGGASAPLSVKKADIVRRIISFGVAAALVLAGVWLLLDFVIEVQAYPSGRARTLFAGAAAMLIGLGGWWLWADFIAPLFGITVED
jgi:hypothetical protein